MEKFQERIDILGCPIDNLNKSETVERIDNFVTDGNLHQHVVVNVDKLLKVRSDNALKQVVSGCDIINADGMPIVWVSKILGNPLKERVAGIDLMDEVVKLASQKGYKIYFLGARTRTVEKVIDVYSKKYTGLKVAGFRNGYWEFEDERDVVNEIKGASPDILFVAISSPKKEYFLGKYINDLKIPFVMGVGGSFDVIAGVKKRAPKWMQKYGLEWFFRLVQEPRRMWKRYLVGNAIFVGVVIKEIFNKYILRK